MTVKSSGPFGTDASVDAPGATTGGTTEEEDVAEDAGMTVALVRSGVTDLMRIAGRTSVTRGSGGTNLVRIAHKATQASLLCHRRQGEMKTIIRTRGLGASRSHKLSPVSWAELRP